jgi:predicted nucleic acid-binding protein
VRKANTELRESENSVFTETAEGKQNGRMQLLLDTSVLIDALRLRHGRRQWLAELVRAGHTLATSALNLAEVYAGMRPEEEARTKAFLSALECLEITASLAEMAGKLKRQWAQKGRTLTLADTVIAAVALQQSCPLATDNRKDFPMPQLQLYELPK